MSQAEFVRWQVHYGRQAANAHIAAFVAAKTHEHRGRRR